MTLDSNAVNTVLPTIKSTHAGRCGIFTAAQIHLVDPIKNFIFIFLFFYRERQSLILNSSCKCTDSDATFPKAA